MQKLTPKEAVRAFCTECLGMEQFNTEKVRNCGGDKKMNGGCLFFPYRLGKRPPVKLFRKFCMKDCMNGNRDLIATCMIENCPNYLYRQEENRMEIPIIAVLIGLIPAAIAQSKGRSVLGFWILSFVTLCFITLL